MNKTYGEAGTKDSEMGDIVNEENGLRRYCGAGYIQLSTRTNYEKFAISMNDPEILNQGVYYVAEKYSWQATGWWWENNNMNEYIDSGHSVKEVSIRVNGGTNGLKERTDAYDKIVEYFN
jgi:predicted chitinase